MSKISVLAITQKIDENDNILGSFCDWLKNLAKKIDKIYVVTLEKKEADLARNIELYSLGKEDDINKLKRFLKFNQVLLNLCLNKKIDIIFIHMCPEYVFLSWLYAKLKNIPIVMWYAHGSVDLRLRIASLLVNRVISSSRAGYRINSRKLTIVGQGIDINKFTVHSSQFTVRSKKIILSVGRISPIKNYEALIKTADILVNQKNIRDLKFQIVGGVPLESQERYLDFLKNLVSQYKLQDYIQFNGLIPYGQIQNYYHNCDLFVSTSNTGSLDKSALEAMACGKIVLTCNQAFLKIFGPYSNLLIFEREDFRQLADSISYLLGIDKGFKGRIINEMRKEVEQNHNLDYWADRITDVFNEVFEEHRGKLNTTYARQNL